MTPHREDGLEINEWTSCPNWDGTPLDLDWAMLVLLRDEPGAADTRV
ncbi:MAG: hypothetical protein ACE5JI_19155 [Acidobacteriota bacterium]